MSCEIKEKIDRFMREVFHKAIEWKIIDIKFPTSEVFQVLYANKHPQGKLILKATKVYFNEIVSGTMTPRELLVGVFGKKNFITTYQVSIKSKHGLQNYPPFTTLWNISELVERELETHDECAVQIIKTKQYLEKDKSKKDVKRVNIPVQEG